MAERAIDINIVNRIRFFVCGVKDCVFVLFIGVGRVCPQNQNKRGDRRGA